MNRRQFLGRLFQAVISAHNSNSTYGIYHPWRQYNDIKTYVYIYLQYRTGINPDYDPSNPNSSQYKYNSIPYTGGNGPIMALYDSNDTMIYCSAYYQPNGTLYNNISTSIYFTLPAGTYTLKCLSLGKGLYLGESGQSLTFTVEPVSREIDPSTGEYNKYNNYGWINMPALRVDFLFDYEGLSFDLEVEYVDHGTDINDLDGVTKYTYTPPTYNEWHTAIKSVYNDDPTYDDYMRYMGWTGKYGAYNYDGHAAAFTSGAAPYNFAEYGDKVNIIEAKYYASIYEHKGLTNISLRGKTDITPFGCFKDLTKFFIYNKTYNEKGLTPNIDLFANAGWIDDQHSLYMCSELDGTFSLYSSESLHNYINTTPTFTLYRYPGAVYTEFEADLKAYTTDAYKTYLGCNVYIDENTTEGRSVPIIRFTYTKEYYAPYDNRGVARKEWTGYCREGRIAGENSTPEEEMMIRINIAQTYEPNARQWHETALKNWGKTNQEGNAEKLGVWVQPMVIKDIQIDVPLDVILGNFMGDLTYVSYSAQPKNSSGIKVVTSDDGRTAVMLNSFGEYDCPLHPNSLSPILRSKHFKTVHIESNINISGYEFCTDYSTGWFNNLVLRQEIVHLDLSDVPDHPMLQTSF